LTAEFSTGSAANSAAGHPAEPLTPTRSPAAPSTVIRISLRRRPLVKTSPTVQLTRLKKYAEKRIFFLRAVADFVFFECEFRFVRKRFSLIRRTREKN
jgi:hypothetical protein